MNFDHQQDDTGSAAAAIGGTLVLAILVVIIACLVSSCALGPAELWMDSDGNLNLTIEADALK